MKKEDNVCTDVQDKQLEIATDALKTIGNVMPFRTAFHPQANLAVATEIARMARELDTNPSFWNTVHLAAKTLADMDAVAGDSVNQVSIEDVPLPDYRDVL